MSPVFFRMVETLRFCRIISDKYGADYSEIRKIAFYLCEEGHNDGEIISRIESFLRRSSKVIAKKHLLFKYRELWRITEWKNGAIYKTEFECFIPASDLQFYDPAKYVTSSISTSMHAGDSDEVELKPFSQLER